MGKGKAQAQALAQKQEAISATESFQLVQCLVRVSVYHVCWMRGLFPEDSFSGHELSQLDKMNIKVLRPQKDDEEAATLQQWVDEGVMDAVREGYLKNMYFGIAQDAAATHLLEEYIYSFKYGEDGVTFEVNTKSHGKTKDKYSSANTKQKQPPNVDLVRYQVVRLMRMLVQVCQTLDQVPDERYLFIKLTYHDHTPEDYEPPGFHAVKEESIGHFNRRPFSMDVGSMDTHHHTVAVRIKSVLDSCDDMKDGDEDMQELEGSQQISGMMDALVGGEDEAGGGGDEQLAGQDGRAAAACNNPKARAEEALRMLVASQLPDADNMMMGCEATLAPPNTAATPPPSAAGAAAAAVGPAGSADVTCASEGGEDGQGEKEGEEEGLNQEAGSPVSPGSSGQAYEAVRTYCLGRSQVNFLDVMAVFYELPPNQLHLVFDGLQMEGLLQAGPDKETFTVVQPNQPSQGMMDVDGDGDAGVVGDTSWPGSGQQRQLHQQQQHEQQEISQLMTGLSVGAQRAAGAGDRAAAAGAANASVLAKNAVTGSLASGLPAQPRLQAPTAAHNQAAAADAADEPSVQQGAADEQPVWFDASQRSLMHPKAAAAAEADPAAAGAAAAAATPAAAAPAAGRPNRSLRKASYVDRPIYQSSGKQRGASNSKHGAEKENQLGVAPAVQKHGSKGAGRKAAAGSKMAAAGGNKGTPVRGSRLTAMK